MTSTKFQSYPDVPVDLSADAKVSGRVRVVFRGNGSIFVTTSGTGAHINDDNPAVDFRGESWLVHIDYTRADDGSVSVTEYTDPDRPSLRPWRRDSVTRRQNWSDAPPSYHAAIVEGLKAAVHQSWTPELERAGLEADVAQKLHSLEREADELSAKLKDVRAKIRRQHKRLA